LIVALPITSVQTQAAAADLQHAVYAVPLSDYFGSRLADFASARQAIERNSFADGNWDGDGALAISREAKANAIAALAMMEMTAVPAPEIAPNPNGTISFEWESERGVGQLEIGKSNFAFYAQSYSAPAITYAGSTEQLSRIFGLLVSDFIYPKSGAESSITDLAYSRGDV
jgi:hypothetical protein